jgi:hypothetical protein
MGNHGVDTREMIGLPKPKSASNCNGDSNERDMSKIKPLNNVLNVNFPFVLFRKGSGGENSQK